MSRLRGGSAGIGGTLASAIRLMDLIAKHNEAIDQGGGIMGKPPV